MNRKLMLRPVLLAACFLVFACILYAKTYVSAEKQAERWVKELYTVRRDLDFPDWVSETTETLYEKRFGNQLTEEGQEALQRYGLPYVILLQQTEVPVERSHVSQVLVETAPLESEEAGKKSFRYEVVLDVTLEKGELALAPVQEQSYSGRITLEKNGFFGWKLCDFTLGSA